MPGAGRVGDRSSVPADSHGCPACPHAATGPATAGSPDVFVNDKPVLRVGDPGVHAACCGPNKWKAHQGAPGVFVNDKPVHRLGDAVLHCGGSGRLVQGSGDVIVGNIVGPTVEPPPAWVEFVVRDDTGQPVAGQAYTVTLSDGTVISGTTGSDGVIRYRGIAGGSVGIRIGNHVIRRGPGAPSQ